MLRLFVSNVPPANAIVFEGLRCRCYFILQSLSGGDILSPSDDKTYWQNMSLLPSLWKKPFHNNLPGFNKWLLNVILPNFFRHIWQIVQIACLCSQLHREVVRFALKTQSTSSMFGTGKSFMSSILVPGRGTITFDNMYLIWIMMCMTVLENSSDTNVTIF